MEISGVLFTFLVGMQTLLDGTDDGLRGDAILLVVRNLADAAVFGDVDQGLDGIGDDIREKHVNILSVLNALIQNLDSKPMTGPLAITS